MTRGVGGKPLALKFLNKGALGPYSKFSWPVPNGKPGAWVDAGADLIACERGIHAATFTQAPRWLREECYVIELSGRHVEAEDKLVYRKGRLLRRVESWDKVAMVRFAADCAAHVLKLFEAKYPDDGRPRKAIEAARAWAREPNATNATNAAYAAYATAAYAANATNAAYATNAYAAYATARAWQAQRLLRYIDAPEVMG